MAGHAHGDAVQTGTGQVADRTGVSDGSHQGQGSGPEGLRQATSAVVEDGQGFGLHGVGDMGDQGVEARAALGLEDRGDGDGVGGIGGQAIDGLCRQDNQSTRAQGVSRLRVRGRRQAGRA